MNALDLIFLLDRLTKHDEKGLLASLRDNPEDDVTRAAYSDWLSENGYEDSAILVRGGYTPGGRDKKPRGGFSTSSGLGDLWTGGATNVAVVSGSIGVGPYQVGKRGK